MSFSLRDGMGGAEYIHIPDREAPVAVARSGLLENFRDLHERTGIKRDIKRTLGGCQGGRNHTRDVGKAIEKLLDDEQIEQLPLPTEDGLVEEVNLLQCAFDKTDFMDIHRKHTKALFNRLDVVFDQAIFDIENKLADNEDNYSFAVSKQLSRDVREKLLPLLILAEKYMNTRQITVDESVETVSRALLAADPEYLHYPPTYFRYQISLGQIQHPDD